ncbi:MAG TPA: 50S ribosomal protein L4 [Vicinamibacterales bacterium]|nr:50S ribosomal protein L4 [Vicinamibacterales bacterium]
MTEQVSIPVVTMSREAAGTLPVPATVVQAPRRDHLLHEIVKAQLASRRAGTHATKTRGEVRGGGKKPWRQKGTGRARAGSIRSPLWPGGGTIFGPLPRSYGYRLPRGARRAALCSALSGRLADERVVVVDAFVLPEPKTKAMLAALGALDVGANVLVVLADADEGVMRAARNLPTVKVLPAVGLNVYDVLRYDRLVITSAALESVCARIAGEGA